MKSQTQCKIPNFGFIKQAGKEIGGIFKTDQMKGFQQYQNPTPNPSFNPTPKPNTPTPSPTLTNDLWNAGKTIASGTLALAGLQVQLIVAAVSVAGTIYLISQNSNKRKR